MNAAATTFSELCKVVVLGGISNSYATGAIPSSTISRIIILLKCVWDSAMHSQRTDKRPAVRFDSRTTLDGRVVYDNIQKATTLINISQIVCFLFFQNRRRCR